MSNLAESTPESRPTPPSGGTARLVGPLIGSILLLIAGVNLTAFAGVPGEGFSIVGLLFGLILIIAGLGTFLSAIYAQRPSLLAFVVATLGYLTFAVCLGFALPYVLYLLL